MSLRRRICHLVVAPVQDGLATTQTMRFIRIGVINSAILSVDPAAHAQDRGVWIGSSQRLPMFFPEELQVREIRAGATFGHVLTVRIDYVNKVKRYAQQYQQHCAVEDAGHTTSPSSSLLRHDIWKLVAGVVEDEFVRAVHCINDERSNHVEEVKAKACLNAVTYTPQANQDDGYTSQGKYGKSRLNTEI